MTEPLAISVAEARRQLGGVSVATIYRMLQRQELDGRRVGGRRVILTASVKRVLEAA